MASDTVVSIPVSIIAGGLAGLTVDIALFPLDTLKTRLQSPLGFNGSGGFRNLYNGIGVAAMGSVPTASLFFFTYNSIKEMSHNKLDPAYHSVVHMGAAAAGEVNACLIKVPIEVVKQRQQAVNKYIPALQICRAAIKEEGYLGMYRGFTTTVLREVPFVIIQFPVWEYLKDKWRLTTQHELGVTEVSICGALSGGVAAAATTPFDVAKTRIMLATKKAVHPEGGSLKFSTSSTLFMIYKEHGVTGLFAGFVPRTLWITLGGAVFFGAYQAGVNLCSPYFS